MPRPPAQETQRTAGWTGIHDEPGATPIAALVAVEEMRARTHRTRAQTPSSTPGHRGELPPTRPP